MNPSLIRQEHACGCGAAAVAMVAGLSYRYAASWFLVRAWQNAQHDGRRLDEAARDVVEPHDFTRHGITHWEIEHFLACHRFAVARIWKEIRPGEERQSWPPAPLADAHICCVMTVSGNHYVVWLRDGRVLDPAYGETTLDDQRYCGLSYVLAVVPLNG